jgi:hypothetical protein
MKKLAFYARKRLLYLLKALIAKKMDMKSKTTMELLSDAYRPSQGRTRGITAAKPIKGDNMDGFFRAPQGTATLTPTRPTTHMHVPNHAQAHKPQLAKTLMRSAVKPPAPGFKQQATIQGSLQHKIPGFIVTKQSVGSINPHRLSRAANVERSPHIARHHSPNAQPIAVSYAPLQVQTAPDKPETSGAPAPQPTNKPIDIFEHAVANAGNYVDLHAHNAHFKKHVRHHITSMAAGVLALVFIAGFAAYQNTPGLQFKVASMQAGISTHLPNFQAAGFAYNGVRAQNGKLTVGFTGQGAQYQLTQQSTNWDNRDMIQNISSTDAGGVPDYRTLKVNGTEVYKLRNNTATWVAGGQWYQVTGNNILSDEQLKSLVSHI